jgi:hypothetical protein
MGDGPSLNAFDRRFLTFAADVNDHLALKVFNKDWHVRLLAGTQKRFEKRR